MKTARLFTDNNQLAVDNIKREIELFSISLFVLSDLTEERDHCKVITSQSVVCSKV